MNAAILGALSAISALALVAGRVPISFAFGAIATIGIYILFAFPPGGGALLVPAISPTLTTVTDTTYGMFLSYDLIAIPLFVALGHVGYRSGITGDIYNVARVWMARVPGGLALASVAGAGGFSAISGSSIACAATMGRIAVPEMTKYGYDDRLSTGSVVAGGTLGALIPPSILFILYGIFTEQSVSKLFMAAVIPGLISIVAYWLLIILWASLYPSHAPRTMARFTMREKLLALLGVWKAVLIFSIILGGIYGGFFTPTEAAAVSLFTICCIAFVLRLINWRTLIECLRDTLVQTSAIFLIAAAAQVFVILVSLTGASHSFAAMVIAADPGPVTLIVGVIVLYLILGMFLEPLGIMLLTLPFIIPLVEHHGYDLIWFGVVVVKVLEMGLMTPPVGLNVFVVASVTVPKIPVGRIFVGAMPFFVSDLFVLTLIVAFPMLSLYLAFGS